MPAVVNFEMTHQMAQQPLQVAATEEINVLGTATVLIRERRLILAIIATFVVLAIGIVLLGPKSYTARTVLIQSQARQSSAAQALLGQLPTGLMGLGDSQSGEQQVRAVLASQSLADSVVSRLRPDSSEVAEVRSVLASGTKIRQTDEGALAIEVTAEDPARAAQIANTMPQIANSIMSRLSADAALHKQVFLEQQLAQARSRLHESEEDLVRFQESHSAPAVQEQSTRTIEAAANLEQQILEQEVKVAQLKRSATPDNPELQQAAATLALWREQLRALRAGQGAGNEGIFLPLQRSPELKTSAERLLRGVTEDQQIYASLAQALAQTQIDAQSNLPVLMVLDSAQVPSSPHGVAMPIAVGVALLLGMIFGVVAAFLRTFIRVARLDPDNREFFESLDQMRAGFVRLGPRSIRSGKQEVASR
jgi:uncharacterized protein involved in exopolysaccharide biosynthesis